MKFMLVANNNLSFKIILFNEPQIISFSMLVFYGRLCFAIIIVMMVLLEFEVFMADICVVVSRLLFRIIIIAFVLLLLLGKVFFPKKF